MTNRVLTGMMTSSIVRTFEEAAPAREGVW
jgi:hypothetical protein